MPTQMLATGIKPEPIRPVRLNISQQYYYGLFLPRKQALTLERGRLFVPETALKLVGDFFAPAYF